MYENGEAVDLDPREDFQRLRMRAEKAKAASEGRQSVPPIFDGIDERLEALESMTRHLGDRLEAVLRPEGPSALRPPLDDGDRSPVANRLMVISARIEDAVNGLQALLERIDV